MEVPLFGTVVFRIDSKPANGISGKTGTANNGNFRNQVCHSRMLLLECKRFGVFGKRAIAFVKVNRLGKV